MLGRDLKALAATADLIRLDIEAASLTLISEDGTSLYSVYRGGYSGGWKLVGADVPEMAVAIDAKSFRAYANLFEDEDNIKLTLDDNNLVLRGENSKLVLGTRSDPHTVDDVGRDFAAPSFSGAITMPVVDLLREIEVASRFVSDTNLRPIFTGIKLEAKDNELTMTAFNDAILFRSTISTRTMGSFDMTIMASDLLLGLRLVAEAGNIVLGRLKATDAVIIYDSRKTGTFRCSLLQGEWPNMEPVIGQPRAGSNVTLPANLIKLLTSAGSALGVHEVTLSPGKSGKAFFTLQGEVGSYATTFSGNEKLSVPVTFALESLSSLGGLGNNVTLLVPPAVGVPIIADADHRRCWVLTQLR